LSGEVRRGLPRGVEDLLFSMLEKKPDDRPSSAREIVEKLSMFRAAGDAPARPARARTRPATQPTDRVSEPPATRRTSDAPAAAPPRTDTMTSGAPAPSPPRTDTVALVEANANKPREVPTWLAIVAIVAL